MNKTSKSYPFLYYLAIFIFVLLSGVFWWWIFSDKFDVNHKKQNKNIGLIISDNSEDYLPLIGHVEPIDEDYINIDSTNNRSIISNRVNIALKENDKNILEFASDFKNTYPSTDYEIIYLDTVVNRLQVKLPEKERMAFKSEVKSKMKDYKLLVWDETLFNVSNYATNDPLLDKKEYRWYLDEINISNVWSQTMGDKSVTIAVIDNGFDLNHPELKGKGEKAYNVTTKDADVTPSSKNHGTHVAATAVGNGNNDSGLLGICPKCSLMPIKIEDNKGYITSSYIIDGILYAIKNGAGVINLSLGIEIPLEVRIPEKMQKQIIREGHKDEEAFWKELFRYASKKNVICVLAAGNSHLLTGLDPFARSEQTIKVGAINEVGNITKFSNFGNLNTLYAPGVDIMSAKPNNSYEFLDGTSMASPIVAGFIGLIKSVNKEGDNKSIFDILDKNIAIKDSIKTLKAKTLN